jgi:hypothetical protein
MKEKLHQKNDRFVVHQQKNLRSRQENLYGLMSIE